MIAFFGFQERDHNGRRSRPDLFIYIWNILEIWIWDAFGHQQLILHELGGKPFLLRKTCRSLGWGMVGSGCFLPILCAVMLQRRDWLQNHLKELGNGNGNALISLKCNQLRSTAEAARSRIQLNLLWNIKIKFRDTGILYKNNNPKCCSLKGQSIV